MENVINPSGFFMFSEGTEREHWHEIGQSSKVTCIL